MKKIFSFLRIRKYLTERLFCQVLRESLVQINDAVGVNSDEEMPKEERETK